MLEGGRGTSERTKRRAWKMLSGAVDIDPCSRQPKSVRGVNFRRKPRLAHFDGN